MDHGAYASTPPVSPETTTEPLTFLVADDEQVNLMLLEAILRARGIRVLKAANGEEAVALFRENRVDMVLMDIMMPVMDGYEATRTIKSMDVDGFVPVLFVTAFDDDERLARCIRSGGDDFVTKPVNRVQLNAKIDAWLRTRQLHNTVAWQRDRLEAHQRRLQREQETAARIIERATASSALNIPGVHSHYTPAEILSGDILLAAMRPNGNFIALLGDFTGHGVGAAVGVPSLAETFQAEVERGADPVQLLDNINARLYRVLPVEMFLTVVLVELNPMAHTVGVWNAGMPPVLLVADGEVRHRFESVGLPLGVMENDGLGQRRPETVAMPKGGWLYACSDGLVEATDNEGRLFGSDAMAEVVTRAPAGSGFEQLLSEVADFRGSTRGRDDTSLLAVDLERMLAGTPDMEKDVLVDGHWQGELQLDAATLRRVNPVQPVMDLLSSLGAVEEVRQGCYMVVAELFTNALEHGLLQLDSSLKRDITGFEHYYQQREERLAALDSGSIRVRIGYMQSGTRFIVELEMEDSGPGFDYEAPGVAEDTALESNPMAAGRGLAFIRALCEDVTFFPPGNRVRARYVWSPPAAVAV